MTVHVDVIVIGGGVAGLWTLNRLCSAGYNAILLERSALGDGQSVASQGMIHGGIKYALGGALTGASEAIAAMPDHWRKCLAGQGEVNLSDTKVLSDHFHMWSTRSLGSRLGSFFASKMLRGRIGKVAPDQRPAPFDHDDFRGELYELADPVLDVPSLLANLAANCAGRVFGGATDIAWVGDDLVVNQSIKLRAQRYVLCAGKGNAELLKAAGETQPEMQLRPLQQALVEHDNPLALFAHCLGASPSPRLTITSHAVGDRNVWYLGGDLATESINDSAETLIEKAKKELHTLLPWVELPNAQWSTLTVDRAEPKQSRLIKPDQAFAKKVGNIIVGWPTKLTLAPNMGQQVLDLMDCQPRFTDDFVGLGQGLGLAPIATAPWAKAVGDVT